MKIRSWMEQQPATGCMPASLTRQQQPWLDGHKTSCCKAHLQRRLALALAALPPHRLARLRGKRENRN